MALFKASHPDTPVSSERRGQILARTFERDVIPHLLRRSSIHHTAVAHLASLCIRADARAVVAAIRSAYQPAIDIDRILLDLLAPTATLLGDWWEDDLCHSTDVAVGLCHLRTAMHVLASSSAVTSFHVVARLPRTLLMPLPGEPHGFGLCMLATFFTRAGWDTRTDTASDLQELHRLISLERADMVGFSVSHIDMLGAARDAIAVVRAATSNPRLIVMVGGMPFVDDPDLAEAVGADGTAIDGARAVITASKLIGRVCSCADRSG